MHPFTNLALTSLSTQLSTQLGKRLLLPQVATATLELIINKALALNNNKSVSFAAVAQKTLTLELAELPFTLCFTVNTSARKTVVIVRSRTEFSDCTINTSINTLNKLKANQSLTQLIKQDELDVTGDIKIAQQFANIAQSLEIDWQTELAKHIGDVPTHKLLQFGNKMTKSLVGKGKQLEADIGEYLVHEKRLVVTNSQINAFNQKTKDLASKVDTLSARIDKLVANIANK
jgi:ubiquinone biosynthesis protein UbiJ